MSLEIQVLQQQKTESGKLYHLFLQNPLYLTLTTVSITRNLFYTSRNSHTLVINSLNLKKTVNYAQNVSNCTDFVEIILDKLQTLSGTISTKGITPKIFKAFICVEKTPNNIQYRYIIVEISLDKKKTPVIICRELSRQSKIAVEIVPD